MNNFGQLSVSWTRRLQAFRCWIGPSAHAAFGIRGYVRQPDGSSNMLPCWGEPTPIALLACRGQWPSLTVVRLDAGSRTSSYLAFDPCFDRGSTKPVCEMDLGSPFQYQPYSGFSGDCFWLLVCRSHARYTILLPVFLCLVFDRRQPRHREHDTQRIIMKHSIVN